MANPSKPKGLQGQYAGFVSRAIALIVDLLIVVAVIAVVNGAIALTLQLFLGVNVNACPPVDWRASFLSRGLLCYAANWLRIILSVVVNPLYFALFWTLGGQSLGQYAFGLRVVRLDGKRMTFWPSLVRWFGYMLSFFALGLGYLWVLWDDRRQGFADKLAKTVVVYSWEAKQNEFLLDRLRQRRRSRRSKAVAASARVQAVVSKPLRLEVVLAVFPTMNRLRDAMNTLQGGIRDSSIELVTSAVLVKDETGALGYVGSSDLAIGDRSAAGLAVLAADPRLKQVNVEQLTADVPNGSFVLLVVVEDKKLTPLLKGLTSAKVAANVFDLDMPAHAPMTVSPDSPKPGELELKQQAIGGAGSPSPWPATSSSMSGTSLSSILTGQDQS